MTVLIHLHYLSIPPAQIVAYLRRFLQVYMERIKKENMFKKYKLIKNENGTVMHSAAWWTKLSMPIRFADLLEVPSVDAAASGQFCYTRLRWVCRIVRRRRSIPLLGGSPPDPPRGGLPGLPRKTQKTRKNPKNAVFGVSNQRLIKPPPPKI